MGVNDRRAFLAKTGAAAACVGVLGSEVSAAVGIEGPTKKVVAGSPYPTFSRAVICGPMVYVSGVLGQRPGTRDLASADFAGQCQQAMANLKASVEAAGSSMDKVVKCGAFLCEQSDFAKFNEIYVTYFPAEPPARSTVIVKDLVAPGALIEIDCVAHL
jgi:reactive intermediate/imine deaminase